VVSFFIYVPCFVAYDFYAVEVLPREDPWGAMRPVGQCEPPDGDGYSQCTTDSYREQFQPYVEPYLLIQRFGGFRKLPRQLLAQLSTSLVCFIEMMCSIGLVLYMWIFCLEGADGPGADSADTAGRSDTVRPDLPPLTSRKRPLSALSHPAFRVLFWANVVFSFGLWVPGIAKTPGNEPSPAVWGLFIGGVTIFQQLARFWWPVFGLYRKQWVDNLFLREPTNWCACKGWLRTVIILLWLLLSTLDLLARFVAVLVPDDLKSMSKITTHMSKIIPLTLPWHILYLWFSHPPSSPTEVDLCSISMINFALRFVQLSTLNKIAFATGLGQLSGVAQVTIMQICGGFSHMLLRLAATRAVGPARQKHSSIFFLQNDLNLTAISLWTLARTGEGKGPALVMYCLMHFTGLVSLEARVVLCERLFRRVNEVRFRMEGSVELGSLHGSRSIGLRQDGASGPPDPVASAHISKPFTSSAQVPASQAVQSSSRQTISRQVVVHSGVKGFEYCLQQQLLPFGYGVKTRDDLLLLCAHRRHSKMLATRCASAWLLACFLCELVCENLELTSGKAPVMWAQRYTSLSESEKKAQKDPFLPVFRPRPAVPEEERAGTLLWLAILTTIALGMGKVGAWVVPRFLHEPMHAEAPILNREELEQKAYERDILSGHPVMVAFCLGAMTVALWGVVLFMY